MKAKISIPLQIYRLEQLGFLQASGITARSLQNRFGHEPVETCSTAVVKVLVLSPPCVSLATQFELAGLAILDLDLRQMKDYWVPHQVVYIATIRIDEEQMVINYHQQTRGHEFQSGERGSTMTEAIHLFLHYPQLLNRHLFDCYGTLYGEEGGHFPIIYQWNGHPEVGEACPGVFCQAAITGGPALRVLDPLPAETNWEV